MSTPEGDASDSLLSSDSEDEFLTSRRRSGNNNAPDREAMVRRKLLESFYGKEASALAASSGNVRDGKTSLDTSSSSEDEEEDALHSVPVRGPSSSRPPNLFQSPVHPLLDTEEQLACQVRTLESRLQTLVYENYSRFIDATDAMKSMDATIQAHTSQLQALPVHISKASEQVRDVEQHVGSLRDQVVEKLRVQRLLQRLDTLLKLPASLQEHVSEGRYPQACQSYSSAHAILQQHLEGFESLRKIQRQCQCILKDKVYPKVTTQIWHWSGNNIPNTSSTEEADEFLPDPPQSITKIWESAAATALLELMEWMPKPQEPSCSSVYADLAFAASLRYLERTMDTHHLMGTPTENSTMLTSSSNLPSEQYHSWIPISVLEAILEVVSLYQRWHSCFCPRINATTLEEQETEKTPNNDNKADDQDSLRQFVTQAFSEFLHHVKNEWKEQQWILYEPQTQSANTSNKTTTDNPEHPEPEESNPLEEELSTAMATLELRVQHFVQTLEALGMTLDTTNNFIQETRQLTQSMVQKQVAQKYQTLQQKVLTNGLQPFWEHFQNESHKEQETTPLLLQANSLASVALSDSLQLMDDTIRSILGRSTTSMNQHNREPEEQDYRVLQEAVQSSAQDFAQWLACVMEVLAGWEESTIASKEVLPAPPESTDSSNPPKLDSNSRSVPGPRTIYSEESWNVALGGTGAAPLDNGTENKVEQILWQWVRSSSSESFSSDRVLAIAEMCRVAERSVAENIQQSIIAASSSASTGATSGSGAGASGGTGMTGTASNHANVPRKSSSTSTGNGMGGNRLFLESSLANAKKKQNPITQRFRLAASRVLTLYATNQGHHAASLLCMDMYSVSQQATAPQGPRAAVCQVLEICKTTSQDCADLFGGDRRAGPIPQTVEDEYASLAATRRTQKSNNNRSGLVLDVERMFAEKVVIYPHCNELIDFHRNGILTLVLKVVLKATLENVRRLRFTLDGYRQLLVDVEFLKWMVPHYIADEALCDSTNARTCILTILTELAHTAKDRCTNADVSESPDVEEINGARGTIRKYISTSLYSKNRSNYCVEED